MNIKEIGNRGAIFEFDDPYFTNVMVINGKETVFVCDTYCGPDSMKPIIDYIDKIDASSKDLVVFNSHYHYDHIWGNCGFDEPMIVSHVECRDIVKEERVEMLQHHKSHMRGKIEVVPPNFTFQESVTFHDEGIVFFYTPGHTRDSSSCLDLKDRVLFVADNVESPIPFFYESDLYLYASTLRYYFTMDWKFIVPGHDPVITDDTLLSENLRYVDRSAKWEIELSELDEKAKDRHVANLCEIAKHYDSGSLGKQALMRYTEALQFLKERNDTKDAGMIQRIKKLFVG
ncbi:MAG: MBL fold metallo-hydrolase [Candidatus Thorarchaeota archaeon]|jgi:glyoxylase-like metal-dependent hydrolase (beta-lactamase superfamily II)